MCRKSRPDCCKRKKDAKKGRGGRIYFRSEIPVEKAGGVPTGHTGQVEKEKGIGILIDMGFEFLAQQIAKRKRLKMLRKMLRKKGRVNFRERK